MQSFYSWMGTELHLILEDAIADNYNEAAMAFEDAQKSFFAKHERHWQPNEALNMECSPEAIKAWNDVAELMNHLVELNGGGLEIYEKDIKTNLLVKLQIL